MWVRRADAIAANRDIAAGWQGPDFQSSSLHTILGAAQGSEETCHPCYCLHLKLSSCAVYVPLYFFTSW